MKFIFKASFIYYLFILRFLSFLIGKNEASFFSEAPSFLICVPQPAQLRIDVKTFFFFFRSFKNDI